MNIAINGFGRIGRLFFKQSFDNKDINVVVINDLGSLANLAYLLKYDTVYKQWDKEISFDEDKGVLRVGDKEIKFISQKDPTQLPWKDLDIDVVVEATGVFSSYKKSKVHLDAGAKRVVITAPSHDEDGELGQTVLMGVNENKLSTCSISSNGSCTTNASSPVISVMSENPGIIKAMLTTVHGYTATQGIVDGPSRGSDFRRGRAAGQNIVPSTTGAAIAVARALPEFNKKFDGIAMRVPVVSGSLADITFISKRDTTPEEINDIFVKASQSEKWRGILSVTNDPIVSSDIIGRQFGAIIDLGFTRVVDGNLVKVLSWYDNEAGYVSTLVKHVLAIKNLL